MRPLQEVWKRLLTSRRRARPVELGPYGIPVPVLTAIGKVAAAAGHLEMAAFFIAQGLGRDTRDRLFKATLDQIRSVAKAGLPPHCTCTSAELKAWCNDAEAVMQRRNGRLHSAFVERATHGGLVPGQLDRKQGAFLPASEEAFLVLFNELHETMQRGLDLGFAVQPPFEGEK